MIAPRDLIDPGLRMTADGPDGDPADVLVVGAGPAGASTALRLARQGLSVTLMDARSFPRSKPCGDALSPGAIPLLEELGVWSRLGEAAGAGHPLHGWRIRSPSGRWIEGTFDPNVEGSPPYGLGIDRARLDAAIVDAAADEGVRLAEGRRVFHLVHRNGRAAGVVARGPDGREEHWPARFVVGADGLRSRVARLLGPVRRGARPRLALVARYAAAGEPGRFGELRLSGEGVLGWAPTGPDSANLTLVVPAELAPEMSGDPAAFFEGRIAAYGAGDRALGLRDRPIEITGPFETMPSRRSAPGALLVGDAAGYFDPFTGQGVFRALLGGRLAADAITAALERPDEEARALRSYEAALGGAFDASQRFQRLLDRIVSRPLLMNAAARLLAGHGGLVSGLVDVTGDRLPPRALLRRSLSRDPLPAEAPWVPAS